jgi:Microtubule associated protein (MAP65/ASE1 family)
MDPTVFQQLSQETFQRLQELWQEIGTKPEQQTSVLAQLQADLKNVYENTVQHHLQERSRLQSTIQEAQLKLRQLQTILHFPFSEVRGFSWLSLLLLLLLKISFCLSLFFFCFCFASLFVFALKW